MSNNNKKCDYLRGNCDKNTIDIVCFYDDFISEELHEKIMSFRYELKNAKFNNIKSANSKLKHHIAKIINRYKVSDLHQLMFSSDEDSGMARIVYMQQYPELYHTVQKSEGCYERALFTEIIFSYYTIYTINTIQV